METRRGGTGGYDNRRSVAGRLPNSGRYGEPTVSLRIPASKVSVVSASVGKWHATGLKFPLITFGKPSEASMLG